MIALIDHIEEHGAMVRPLSILCLVVMGLAFTGCDSRESAWLNAEEQNTISAYETFVRQYPDGEHVEEARERIEDMKFASAQAAGAADDLEAYLAAYPRGRHADQAKQVLRQLRYQSAVESATLAEHLRFLQQYPDGEDSDELRNALTSLPKWEESRKLGELVLAMSPKTRISFSMSTGVPRSPSLKTEKPAGADADWAILRQLLADGAVPSAVRVAGWEPGGAKPHALGGVMMSTGSPGRIVPASQEGMTLLEYCKANKLDRVCELLSAHEANRHP